MAARIFQLFALVAVAARFAAASPTPAFVTVMDPVASDAAPISAIISGVDAQGHTTYAFEFTASLATEYNIIVAGSDYYSFAEEFITTDQPFGEEGQCGLEGSVAICTVVGASTAVFTETGLGTIVLDIGTAAPGNGPSGSPPTPTNKPNSGHRVSCSVLVFIVISLRLVYHLM
ncbi:hypothetical protein B0H11DRAFT_2292364 [Mycena galericulata]|nr:hypothetical protein B0H11DRAFT_2292364 [Mycena galericulata]